MAYAFITAANDEVITVPVGTSNGHVLVVHHRVTLRGSNRDTCIIKGDNLSSTFNVVITTFGPILTPDGLPVDKLTLENLTLDGTLLTGADAVCFANLTSGPKKLILKNVRIITAIQSHAVIVTNATLEATQLQLLGDGRGVTGSGAKGFIDTDFLIEGGLGAFIVDSAGLPVTAFRISDADGRLDYWAGPRGELVTATAFAATYVDVSSHNSAQRTAYDVVRVLTPRGTVAAPAGSIVTFAGIAEFDRIEASDGTWCQVESVLGSVGTIGRWYKPQSWIPAAAAPVGTVTVYAVAVGRLTETWTSTRLNVFSWHTVRGVLATPTIVAGQRVELRRASTSGPRDVDVGAIHFTLPCRGCVVMDSYFRGSFSDVVTARGERNVIYNTKVELGQDMGFTSGPGLENVFEKCTADYQGIGGFACEGIYGSVRSTAAFVDCKATNSYGQLDALGSGWGIRAGADNDILVSRFTASGNRGADTFYEAGQAFIYHMKWKTILTTGLRRLRRLFKR